MSIDDSISSYSSEEKYISEFEELSRSKDVSSEKCLRVFESCRAQFQSVVPSLTSGAPSHEQIRNTIAFLKTDLKEKKAKLAKEIVKSGLNLLDSEVYKKFPPSLRFEIAKCFSERKGSKLSEVIKAYDITDQNDLFELVKHKMEFDIIPAIKEFQSYGITDEQKRFELAKIFILGDYGKLFLEAYDFFNISDPLKAFELMKMLTQRHPDACGSKNIDEIITEPEQRLELLRVTVSTMWHRGATFNLEGAVAYIVEQKCENKDKIFDLVQLLAKLEDIDIIKHLDILGITDTNEKQIIYKICYENAMKKFYLQGDKTKISSLSFPNDIIEGVIPNLKSWLDRAIVLNVPAQFETDTEKTKWEETFKDLLSDLTREANTLGISQSWVEKMFPKADSQQQRMKYLLWLGDFLIRCGFEPALKSLFEKSAADLTFNAIFKLTNPILQEACTSALVEIYKNPDKKKSWMALAEGKPEHLLLTSLLLAHAGIPEKASQKILESFKTRRYLDYKLMQSINEMISFLTEKSDLSVQDRTRLLEMALNEPVQGQREAKKKYQKRLEEHRKNQETLLIGIPTIVLFGRLELLENVADADALANRWVSYTGKLLGIQNAEELKKLNTLFCKSKRYPNGIFLYAGRLQTLLDEQKLLLNKALNQFVLSVIDGTFPSIRYEFANNAHLKTVFEGNSVLFDKWKSALPISLKSLEGLIVQDTDQWEDLLLLGTEVSDSCQSLDHDPKYSKCLFAYILDGKNRAIVIKNKQGKIVARSVLRILWDSQKKEPVLFMERFYTSQSNPAFAQMLREGCLQKARYMGLPLVASIKDYPDLQMSLAYPGALEALGGPVPFEYVDAVEGVTQEGKFTIPESRVIFDPKA